MRFSLRFLNASWFGPLRFGSVPRSVSAGSEIKRFGSVRPIRFGLLFLPLLDDVKHSLRCRSIRDPAGNNDNNDNNNNDNDNDNTYHYGYLLLLVLLLLLGTSL